MYFAEELKEYKKVGFVSNAVKRGVASKKEVEAKFAKAFAKNVKAVPTKFVVVNGVPHKRVGKKLVPLTRIES